MPDSTPAAYSLVSWVRRGLASLITAAPATNYASLPVSLTVNGAPAPAPEVRLIGPGQITALDGRAVVRTNPRDGTLTFEPNYMPMVELALPDLPWMFTPSVAANDQLSSWLCLVVVPDAAGATIQNLAGGLTALRLESPLDPKVELPDLTAITNWAHAQVTGTGLSGGGLNSALDGDPSLTLSRLICHRKLEPDTSYLACVVPTYRAGVNAGLGLAVDDHDLAPAWDANVTAPFVLPVYYYFRFKTGAGGDFASLAQKITPPATKLDAGTRTMDVSEPGFGAAAAGGVTLGLEGALRSEENQPTPWPDGAQAAYEGQLRAALVPPAAPDPVVAPPTYGEAQSGKDLPPAGAAPFWLSELNLDPRTRAAASAGAEVVQRDQEALVASSWEQLGEIRKANQLLRQAQLAREVSASLYRRHLNAVAGDGTYLQMTAPLHSRVVLNMSGAQATLYGHIATSRVPAGAVSPTMLRIGRPGSPIGRQLPATVPQIVDRLNQPVGGGQNALLVAGPVQAPRGMVAFDDVSANLQIANMSVAALTNAPGWHLSAVVSRPILPVEPAKPLDVGELPIERPPLPEPPVKPLPPGPVSPQPPLVNWNPNPNLPVVLGGGLKNMPAPIVFPSTQAALAVASENFRTAAMAVSTVLNLPQAVEPDPAPLGGLALIAPTRSLLATRLNPEITIPARLSARIPLNSSTDAIQPLNAGPQFPQPMYSALVQLSAEWLLPGISNVPNNCAALLLCNTRFIESFMVGLNEELTRELLWRGFPANSQMTYFQNFWGGRTPDIPAINSFDPNGHLGDHVVDYSSGSRFVLLIRSELFHQYPNAVVSAIQAQWAGNVRLLTDTRVYPLFRGSIGEDVTFFGFDVSDPGGTKDPAENRPGWYFVIEEHVTEPRFGLEPAAKGGDAWNDLSWQDVALSGNFLNLATAPSTPVREGVTWNANAASMAFILMRRPVRVALHGLALLGEGV